MSTAAAQSYVPSLMAALFDTAGNAMRQAAQELEARLGTEISAPDFRALLIVAQHTLYVPDWYIMVMANLPNNRGLIACRTEGRKLDPETCNAVTSAILNYWKYGYQQSWRVQPPN